MTNNLKELESRLRSTLGCWSHYRFRVWQECRSFDAAGADDRTKIAEEILAAAHRGEVIWAWSGFVSLLGEIQEKLNDADAHVRERTAAPYRVGRSAVARRAAIAGRGRRGGGEPR